MSKLDREIDRAVREMLDVEPPAGLRGRVLDRIERSEHPASAWRKIGWTVLPVAAAAIIVLAVLLPPRGDRATVAPVARVATDQHLPLQTPGPTPTPRPGPDAPTRPSPARVARDRQPIRAAVADDAEFITAQVDALPGPAPLAVERLPGPPAPPVRNLIIAPIEIRSIEVNALTESPRERREE